MYSYTVKDGLNDAEGLVQTDLLNAASKWNRFKVFKI